jgi:hypothetical protein
MNSEPASKKTKKRKTRNILFIILALLIVIRLILPYWLLHYVNKQLTEISGYYGHVHDIDLSLYRGAYVVKDLYINKVDSATLEQTELFNAPHIDISLVWAALFHGRIVSELEFTDPLLRFTEDRVEPEQMEKDTNDFRKMLRTFTPISVNRFEVFNGKIGYVDPTVQPKVDVYLTEAHILARNLSNVKDTSALPAKINAEANVYGGQLKLNMRMDALADDPTYDMNIEIKNAELVRLNDFFKAYAGFDVNKGTFNMYMEMAAKNRKFIGYVKPLIKDLDIVGPEDKRDNILKKIWENIVALAADVLEAPKSETIATKVPIVGEYDDRTIGIWYAIWAVLKNAFIQALYPTLDDQVNLKTVSRVKKDEVKKEGFFRKTFGEPGKEKKKSTSSKD